MSETPDKDWPGCPMCARLQRYADTAWNRGHTMGMKANEDTARQAMDALRTEKEAHADTNARLTEDNMRLETERDEQRKVAEIYIAASHELQRERDELRKMLRELVQLNADGRTEYESAIEYWERARAILAKVKP